MVICYQILKNIFDIHFNGKVQKDGWSTNQFHFKVHIIHLLSIIMVLLAIRLSHLLIHLLIMQPNLHIIMQELLLILVTIIQVRLNLWNDILLVAWIVTSKLDLSWYHNINIP